MSAIHSFVNIPDQQRDLKTIRKFIDITNIGIEAITHIYDDHRPDRNTYIKMFALQENLIYRIFTSFHQYEMLIDAMTSKTSVDLNIDPHKGDLQAHPSIYRYSNELSSIVDSIFFHLCSVFDYLGHLISYMFEQNKDKTLDWGSLAKTARAGYKGKLRSAQGIDEIDKTIRIKLEWHRSQLIHKKRDNRSVGISIDEKANRLSLVFAASPDTMKQFKNIVYGYNSESEYTLDCLPSAVFYQTLKSINYLLDFLKIDLLSQSTFEANVKGPKRDDFQCALHPETNAYYPRSEIIWTDYKNKLNHFYLTFGQE